MRNSLFLALVGAAAGGMYLQRRLHKAAQCEKREQVMDNTLDDSFPASDPPSWTSDAGVVRASNSVAV